jgi:Transglycosylase SLT domain
VLVVAVVAAIAGSVVAVLSVTADEEEPQALALPSEIVGPDPLAFDDRRRSAYERAAAFGLSHALFAKSPGGVTASARRTAAYRPLIEDVVDGSGFDPDLVEAIVFLESAGRPDVIAGHDVKHAAGLTQILAETATNFLGMDVDVGASRRLTRRIEAARRRGDNPAVERLRGERRRVDARFDPAQALAGTVRYLTQARQHFGREELAVVSYHMGIGNLTSVLRAYSGRTDDPIDTVVDDEDLDYACVYFDSSPARHRKAWALLASFGDDSQTYYWRVLAAAEIMRFFRENPGELDRLAELHLHGPSAEKVLHPPELTEHFAEPSDLEEARSAGALTPVPDRPRLPYEIGPQVGRLARSEGADPSIYRMLRPQARALLEYVATRVRELSGAEQPLQITSAVYDEAYARLLREHGAGPRAHLSMHATGYSFDIRRRYGSGAQAEAFQYTLERLEALGLIAWMRDERVIHITVSPQAAVRSGSPGRP